MTKAGHNRRPKPVIIDEQDKTQEKNDIGHK